MHAFLVDLANLGLSLAAVALTAATPFIVAKVNSYLHLQAGSQAADDLDQALQHVISMVYSDIEAYQNRLSLTTAASGVPSGSVNSVVTTAKSVAVYNAANMVLKLAPAAKTRLGLNTNDIVALINSKITNFTNTNSEMMSTLK